MKIKLTKDRFIGDNEPCYIIMDVGANHNGNLETAKSLVLSAAENGAEAIKFQTYIADKMYSKNTPAFSKDLMTPYKLIQKYQHPREWLSILSDIAKDNDIDFISTPFDKEAVDILEKINVPYYKVASPEIGDLELIDYIAKKDKPIILSTGMSYLGEIEDAVNIILKNNNNNIILLQCTTLYPAPVETVNLKAIKSLKKIFPFLVGYSDHTLGIHISLAALSIGACIIEKHFTLDRKQEGPDHPFAIQPNELKSLTIKVREIEKAMGDGFKKPHELELKENYQKGKRSIIANQDIKKGTLITKDMLIVKRPGYGIKPKFLDVVIGRNAKIDIKYDQWITWDMI